MGAKLLISIILVLLLFMLCCFRIICQHLEEFKIDFIFRAVCCVYPSFKTRISLVLHSLHLPLPFPPGEIAIASTRATGSARPTRPPPPPRSRPTYCVCCTRRPPSGARNAMTSGDACASRPRRRDRAPNRPRYVLERQTATRSDRQIALRNE